LDFGHSILFRVSTLGFGIWGGGIVESLTAFRQILLKGAPSSAHTWIIS